MRPERWAAFVTLALGCGSARDRHFALRPVVWVDDDMAPFRGPPPVDEEADYANSLDVMVLGAVSRALRLDVGGEAWNANAHDEVPSSSWLLPRSTEAALSPDELFVGPCPTRVVTPLTLSRSKPSGATTGFVARDALGVKYVVKTDACGPRQPEISTAADAIASRLYWAVGFRVPCNEVVFVRPSELALAPDAVEVRWPEGPRPLTRARLAEVVSRATLGPDGTVRLLASRFIEGTPVGTWRSEGTRATDPNDRIPHEERRELRGERLLAAWVSHWDSRGPNTLDTFVTTGAGEGHLEHFFIDFGDALGAVPMRTDHADPRMGHTTITALPTILLDAVSLGLLARPWDQVRPDPRFPNLGMLDVARFDPLAFSPQTPLPRWARADAADLGWMARRIALLGPEHVRAAVRAGRLSDPAESARLVEVLLGRRERLLDAAFARSSPLADVTVRDGRSPGSRLCARDVAVGAGLEPPAEVRATWQGTPLAAARAFSWVCFELPAPVASATPESHPTRYRTMELVRMGVVASTRLVAHLFDLGPARGYVLVGVKRPKA